MKSPAIQNSVINVSASNLINRTQTATLMAKSSFSSTIEYAGHIDVPQAGKLNYEGIVDYLKGTELDKEFRFNSAQLFFSDTNQNEIPILLHNNKKYPSFPGSTRPEPKYLYPLWHYNPHQYRNDIVEIPGENSVLNGLSFEVDLLPNSRLEMTFLNPAETILRDTEKIIQNHKKKEDSPSQLDIPAFPIWFENKTASKKTILLANDFFENSGDVFVEGPNKDYDFNAFMSDMKMKSGKLIFHRFYFRDKTFTSGPIPEKIKAVLNEEEQKEIFSRINNYSTKQLANQPFVKTRINGGNNDGQTTILGGMHSRIILPSIQQYNTNIVDIASPFCFNLDKNEDGSFQQTCSMEYTIEPFTKVAFFVSFPKS